MDESKLDLSVQPVPSTAWIQQGVMVMDGSGSMTLPYADPEGPASGITKGAATERALRDLIKELGQSSLSVHFRLSFISFNDQVTDERQSEPVEEISLDRSYDPTTNGNGGTAIHRGLDAAISMVEGFVRDGASQEVPVSSVVILMSDGEEQDDAVRTAAVAAKLKELPGTRLAACLFATQGAPAYGEDLLQQIVSEPRLYQRVVDIKGLRKFFIETLEASSALPSGPQ
jgi:uncharacterized protein YegL